MYTAESPELRTVVDTAGAQKYVLSECGITCIFVGHCITGFRFMERKEQTAASQGRTRVSYKTAAKFGGDDSGSLGRESTKISQGLENHWGNGLFGWLVGFFWRMGKHPWNI